eukprot:COSAG01_NODE_28232_length_666_cov_0.719577_1_plen_113_part_01
MVDAQAAARAHVLGVGLALPLLCPPEVPAAEISPTLPSVYHHDQNRRIHEQKRRGISSTALVLITMIKKTPWLVNGGHGASFKQPTWGTAPGRDRRTAPPRPPATPPRYSAAP